ncbi:MAG TPA: alcohol dehydrogenase catalytic domain-containing protein, partial [Marmoricola sp.]|nr:alcohol dehydrogenase catalytic domain-containing protein [Marmoricola sp.]
MTAGTGSSFPISTRALVTSAPNSAFEIHELQLDALREGEVLVRVVATGICHTDLTVGAMFPPEFFPRVLGHEGAGVV